MFTTQKGPVGGEVLKTQGRGYLREHSLGAEARAERMGSRAQAKSLALKRHRDRTSETGGLGKGGHRRAEIRVCCFISLFTAIWKGSDPLFR